MKTILAVSMFFAAIVWADESFPAVGGDDIKMVARPALGMKSAVSHDLGYQFLERLDAEAGFPASNDWEKNQLTRYIASGSAGHSITVYGVRDDARQMEILGMAQAIANQGHFGWIHIEFRDAERFVATAGGGQARSGETTLRSALLTKAQPSKIRLSIPPGRFGVLFLADEATDPSGATAPKTEDVIGFINPKPLDIQVSLTEPERKAYPHPNGAFTVMVKYDWVSANSTDENKVETKIGLGLEFTYKFEAHFKTIVNDEVIDGVPTVFPTFELIEWADMDTTGRKTVLGDGCERYEYRLARTEASVRSLILLVCETQEALSAAYKERTGRDLADRLLVPLE